MPKKGYKQCPACAEWIREAARLCRFCGAILSSEPLPEFLPEDRIDSDRALIEGVEERFSLMGLQLSTSQRRRIVDFLKHSGEEYRQATSLFVDICEFTRICERIRGEEVKDLLDLFYLVLTQTVDFFNGMIVQIAGDGAVAAFGAPWACDRDAEAAVRAALEIRDRIGALPAVHGVRFQVATGIATGEVVSSVSWTQRPPIYKIYGASINLASRIQGVAGAGGVAIDPVTHELVRGRFRFREHPPRAFKNIAEPVITFDVTGVEPGGPGRREHAIPYVGREPERAMLEGVWRGFLETRRGAGVEEGPRPGVLIRGEAGIGKTRFCREFLRGRGEEALVVSVESEPFARKVPLGLWRSVLASLWAGDLGERGIGDERSLGVVLENLGFSRPEWVTFQAIFGLSEGIEGMSHLPQSIARRQMVADLRRLLERVAAERPLILAVDDLQWADPTSVEILEALISPPAPQRVFFLLAGRSEMEAPLTVRGRLETIQLGFLDEVERRSLFNLLVDGREFYPEIREAVVERAEGNPFYMIELARALRENLAKRKESEAGRLLPTTIREWVPPALKEMIQARIDQLDERKRQVLQCASVLGRRFAFQIMELFEAIREGLLGRLYSLKALEYLDDLLLPEGLEFLFRHHLTRETAYQSLLERRRQELHGLIAERIEERFASRIEEYLPVLAFHYGRSNREDKAVEYFHRAGDRAGALAAVAEAKECYEEALGRLSRMEPSAEIRRRQIAILTSKGRLHRLQGDQDAALRALQAALPIAELLRASRELARIHAEIGLAALISSDHAEARASLSEALKRAKRLDDSSLLGMIHNGLGICYWSRGEFGRASGHFEKTEGLDLRKSNPRLAADALNNLALIAWKGGELDKARSALRKAGRLYGRAGDRFGVSGTTMNTGIIEETLGRSKAAETLYRQALEVAEGIRFGPVLTATHANLASLLLGQGKSCEALDHAARAAEIADSIHDRRGKSIALENLALAHLNLRQFAEAEQRIGEARALAQAIGDRERRFSLDLVEIELRLAEGRGAGVLANLSRLEKVLVRDGFEGERPRLLRLKAGAYFVEGRLEKARGLAAQALSAAKGQKNRAEQERIVRFSNTIPEERSATSHTQGA